MSNDCASHTYQVFPMFSNTHNGWFGRKREAARTIAKQTPNPYVTYRAYYIYMYAQTQNIEYKYQVYTIQNININIIYSMQYILYTIKCNVDLHPDCSFDSAFSGKCAFLVQKATLPDQKATFPDLGFIVLLAGGVFFFAKKYRSQVSMNKAFFHQTG